MLEPLMTYDRFCLDCREIPDVQEITMATRTLSQERIDWILSEVSRIGSTHRKPDGSDPSQWNSKAQRRRFGGAFPSDLGASRRDQSITRDMYQMVKLGLLDILPGDNCPRFVIAKHSAR